MYVVCETVLWCCYSSTLHVSHFTLHSFYFTFPIWLVERLIYPRAYWLPSTVLPFAAVFFLSVYCFGYFSFYFFVHCRYAQRSALERHVLPSVCHTQWRESVCVYGCCDTVAVAHPRFVQNIKQTKISFSILLCHLLLSTVHTPHGIASSFTHRCCVSQPVLHLPVARHAICFYEYNRKRRAHSPSTQWFSLSLSDSLSGQKAEQPHRQRAYRTIIFAMCILVFAIDIVNGLFE